MSSAAPAEAVVLADGSGGRERRRRGSTRSARSRRCSPACCSLERSSTARCRSTSRCPTSFPSSPPCRPARPRSGRWRRTPAGCPGCRLACGGRRSARAGATRTPTSTGPRWSPPSGTCDCGARVAGRRTPTSATGCSGTPSRRTARRRTTPRSGSGSPARSAWPTPGACRPIPRASCVGHDAAGEAAPGGVEVRRPGGGGRPVVDRRRPGGLPPGAARAARGSARRGDAALAPAAHQRAHRDGAGVGAALRTHGSPAVAQRGNGGLPQLHRGRPRAAPGRRRAGVVGPQRRPRGMELARGA